MSYSNSFPTQRPTLNLDFANSGKLDSRLSYSRSSGGTYLSNEKSLNSENLLLQSQDFNTTWVPGSIATPNGSQTAPDGTSTAWLFSVVSGATVRAGIYQNWTPVANTEYTLITHLKAGTASHGYASMRTNSGDFYAGAVVDFSAGTISVTSAGMTSATGTVTALGSNWFRVTVTATSGTSLSSPQITIGVSDGTAVGTNGRPAWTAAGTETMYAWGAQLSSTNSKVYDSPTTTQIAREYAPLLKTAAADEPRFEYATDGQSVGTAKGLLIEQQFTQLIQWSEEFDNTAKWTGANMSIQPSAGVAPDGTLSADLLVEADEVSGNNAHYVQQFVSVAGLAAGQTYTLSVYAKAAGRNHAAIYTSIGGAAAVGVFSLIDGSNTYNIGNGAWSSADCGNGWFRLQLTFTTTTANNHSVYFYTAKDATTYGYTGNGFGSVLFWGANLTQTSSSMSYLKAEGSQTTKSADSCSVALSNIGLASGQDLTAVVEGETAEIAGAALIGFDDGSSSNYARILRHSNLNYTFDVRTNAVSQAVITLGSSSSDTKFAFRVENNNIGAAADGSSVTTDTSATIGLMTTMQIGNAYWGVQTNGTISRVSIYSEPLSDTNLTALSS